MPLWMKYSKRYSSMSLIRRAAFEKYLIFREMNENCLNVYMFNHWGKLRIYAVPYILFRMIHTTPFEESCVIKICTMYNNFYYMYSVHSYKRLIRDTKIKVWTKSYKQDFRCRVEETNELPIIAYKKILILIEEQLFLHDNFYVKGILTFLINNSCDSRLENWVTTRVLL